MGEVICWNRRSYMGSSITKLKKWSCRGKKIAMAKRREYKTRNRIANYGSTRAGHWDKHNKGKKRQDSDESKCRLCGKVDETVRHIVCECPMSAQKEYKRKHDWVGRKMHWEVCRKIGIDVNEKLYKHEPQKVRKNDSWKILWYNTIQTDYVIEARRPDMVIIDKTKNECKIINFTCPFDSRIEKREKDKMKVFHDLKREFKKIWDTLVNVIPVVVGALGTTPKKLK